MVLALTKYLVFEFTMGKKGKRKNKGTRSGAGGSQGAPDTRIVNYNANIVKTDLFRLKPPSDMIYRTRRTYVGSTMTQVVAESFGGIAGTLSAVNDASSLTGVFDQYRITGIEILFKCTLGEQMTAESGSLVTVLDFDDSTALSSLAQALDYSSSIVTKARENHRRCFKPRVAPAIFASGAFSGYGSSVNQWLNSASTTIAHYGVKWALDPYSSAGAAMVITPYITLQLEFRASR